MLHLRVPATVRIIGLLFLSPLLSAGQSVKMRQSAEWLSHAFAQRLEASFQYQEAILPAGTTTRESYLKVGQRRYLLAETVRLPRDNQLQQDTYLVRPRNGVLRTSFQSRYLVVPSPARSSPSQRVSYYQASVSTDQGIEQTKALLLQNFDPLGLLDERPATGQSAFFYVLANVSAGRGDTLASYQLECPDSSRFCLLTLDERRDARSPRWHANHASTQTWTSTWQGSTHILDWFHLTMRLTVLHQYALGVVQVDAAGGKALQDGLTSIKWHLWHGNTERALEKIRDLDDALATHQDDPLVARKYSKCKPLARLLADFHTYVEQNSGFIVDYAERQRYGERVSTGFVESAVNQVLAKRMVKRQQMQWTKKGAHLLVQARTKVLNEEWEDCFRQQYPGFRPLPAEPLPMAA